MKKTGIILSILGGLLLVVLIIIALLPRIVSSNMMMPYITQAINQRMPGQIQIKAWSLSWFGQNTVNDIVYDNRRENLLARVAELKTSGGILDLILDRDNLGTIEVIEPAVVFTISEKPEIPAPKDPQPAPKPPESKPREDPDTGLPAFHGQFRIADGSFQTVAQEGDEKVIVQNLDAGSGSGVTTLKALTFGSSLAHGSANGNFDSQGNLHLAGNADIDLAKVFAQVPGTRKMVGKDAYQFLKGATIKVPIRGSVTKPKLNQSALQDATGDLMQKVLQKNVEQGAQNLFKNLFKKKE